MRRRFFPGRDAFLLIFTSFYSECSLPDVSTDFYEARLVQRLQRGELDAMASLFDMHVDRVFSYAKHKLGSREDAEEVTSEAFLKAFRQAAEFRGDAPFRAWLFTITRNACYDRLRQPRLITLPLMEADGEAGDHTERMAIQCDLRTALRELSDEYQDVLILCDVEEWSAAEAGALLGKSAAATKSMLYRARAALRDGLSVLWRE